MKYNPFAYIREENDILSFVNTFMKNTDGDGGSKGGEDFWVKAERLLYQALVGYIFYEYPKEYQNMATLVAMLNKMEVREDDETFENEVDILFKELQHGRGYEEDPETGEITQGDDPRPDHFALLQYIKYKQAAGVT